jgi:16S rRNA (uracil1498-N3)-methyltransferase
MHRFYLSPEETRGTECVLPEREARHAAQVLRLRAGDKAIVLNGAGDELDCEVVEVTKVNVRLVVRGRKTWDALPHEITLFQAVPKGHLFESIVQKATELGIRRVVPLLTSRVATRLEPDDRGRKREKWRQVAIESIKQCGSPWLPEIELPRELADTLGDLPSFHLSLLASLRPNSRNPKMVFHSVEKFPGAPLQCAIWVGPEGDFSSEECHAIERSGAVPITLGNLVLRCETAAVYCMSVVNYEFLARSTAVGAKSNFPNFGISGS